MAAVFVDVTEHVHRFDDATDQVCSFSSG